MLREGDLSAGSIAAAFSLTKPAISHHLSVLKEAGLAVERRDGPSVSRALEGMDALIHTAANVSARRRDRDSIYRANVEGTRTVLEAAHQKKGLRVVYTSSVAAIGATEGPVAQTESAPWRPG